MGFDGGYGQVEIGGKYVGVEFHQSRPLPSRISFYYPVANSIDFSTDYWKRYESLPLTVLLKSEGMTDTVGTHPYPYRYTPYRASFKNVQNDYGITFSYDTCEDLPVLVVKMGLRNLSRRPRNLSLETSLQTSLRTSHTYAWKTRASVYYLNQGSVGIARFNEMDSDSTTVFVANVGDLPGDNNPTSAQPVENPILQFFYEKTLDADEQIEIVQLIGTCREDEQDQVLDRAMRQWQDSVRRNEARILTYVYDRSYFSVEDPSLQHTMHWSKAILASNIHHIDDHYVPMPCPAEYNFFFTHDLLLTGLGAVYYDPAYLKRGFHFLASLARADSVLPHAYYWKDSQFVTEYCNPDNWNHLWFIIAASSYLKHSGDLQTLEVIFPMLKKSVRLMLTNRGDDDLMYARRPDWWDTGDAYGARAYITSLMYRALHDYVFISQQLEAGNESPLEYLRLAQRMKEQLADRLWDTDAGYLMNTIDGGAVDRHYYAGSLLAVYYDLVDDDKKATLLETVKDTLLDQHLGVRNAMPPDFHELISLYGFKGMESGLPYFYFNGAVWPHGNAWYALGLLSNDQPNEAYDVLKKYLTIDGVRHSPNGQPSFYECRMTDPRSDQYGEIDKPTFLWAGGWFLNVLYQLAGVRESPWNIYFSPKLPNGYEDTEYDVALLGKLCRATWRGEGNAFRRIEVDGLECHSAVISSPARNVILERGRPLAPYLAQANCGIRDVTHSESDKRFVVAFSGVPGQITDLVIVAPYELQRYELNGSVFEGGISGARTDGAYRYVFTTEISNENNELVLCF